LERYDSVGVARMGWEWKREKLKKGGKKEKVWGEAHSRRGAAAISKRGGKPFLLRPDRSRSYNG